MSETNAILQLDVTDHDLRDDQHDDQDDRQQNELRLKEELCFLDSVYPDEITVYESDCKTKVHMSVRPATGGVKKEQFVSLNLEISLPYNYPDVMPEIAVRNPRGLAESEVSSLQEELNALCLSSLGETVLLQIFELSRERLTNNNIPHGVCAICLCPFTLEGRRFLRTHCFHHFHVLCLKRHRDYFYASLAQSEDMEFAAVSHLRKSQSPELVCPVCKKCLLTSDLDEELSAVDSQMCPGLNTKNMVSDPEDSGEELAYVPDEEMRHRQAEWRQMLEKQKAQGGIIDLEAERNKFSIPQPSSTASLQSLEPEESVAAVTEDRAQRTASSVSVQDGSKRHYLHNRVGGSYGTEKKGTSDSKGNAFQHQGAHQSHNGGERRKLHQKPRHVKLHDRNNRQESNRVPNEPAQLRIQPSCANPANSSLLAGSIKIDGSSDRMAIVLSSPRNGEICPADEVKDTCAGQLVNHVSDDPVNLDGASGQNSNRARQAEVSQPAIQRRENFAGPDGVIPSRVSDSARGRRSTATNGVYRGSAQGERSRGTYRRASRGRGRGYGVPRQTNSGSAVGGTSEDLSQLARRYEDVETEHIDISQSKVAVDAQNNLPSSRKSLDLEEGHVKNDIDPTDDQVVLRDEANPLVLHAEPEYPKMNACAQSAVESSNRNGFRKEHYRNKPSYHKHYRGSHRGQPQHRAGPPSDILFRDGVDAFPVAGLGVTQTSTLANH